MKRKLTSKIRLAVCISGILLLASCVNTKDKKTTTETSETAIGFFSSKTTSLYCTGAVLVEGEIEEKSGRQMECKGNSKLIWEVSVPQNETYELSIIANVTEKGKDAKLQLEVEGNTYEFDVNPTEGPFKSGYNFQRVLLSSKVKLPKGNQKITLFIKDSSSENTLLNIRSIEFLPLSAKADLAAEKARAIASRADVDWLRDVGYGLMFHWTSQSVQPDGSIEKYEDAVNAFDVNAFADMVEETGASYVMFTIGHAEQYCPAPIASWEKIHPGQTTERDLIEEIADVLDAKGVKLICYMHSLHTANFTTSTHQEFFDNFTSILTEFGNRYEDKLAGYWFDCWYQLAEDYPEIDFEALYNTTKVGNKDRVMCLNSWVFPSISNWQDYWAGEVASFLELPEDGYAVGGPVDDIPFQSLLIMEPYWVQQKAEVTTPRFTSEELVDYISSCKENKGAVTINMGIYQNGAVGEEALQVMREVKAQMQK